MDYEMLLLSAVVLVGIAMAGSAMERKLGRVDRRLARTERKLDAILDHLGIVVSDPKLDQVNSFLLQGKKIQAIKAYRESTGADLKEAKDAVERIAGQ